MATKSKNTGEKTTPKSGAGGENKSKDLDIIRKNLAKRSLNVKFDLDNTGYQPVEKIGIGAYGVVCSAIQKKSSERVAIKKIPCVFEALAIAKRTYREIKILKHFKHDNIISIQEILKPKESYNDFKDIYVVFDLMESDLHRIIYSEQPLTEEHIRYFLYQILRGLKYIHSANVVHRDLKPSNLLVNEDCHVRIGDFGMARGVNSQPEEPSHYMTQYVATRWYRAPEILLSLLEYGTAVDMWSVGCIFAEMLGRKHLFPGKDYLTQVKLVLGLLGTPSEAVLKNCQSDVLRRIIKSLGHRQPMPWATLFPKASKKALDLMGKMLVMNPADRITVERALKHPFMSKYHDPDDEPICVPSFEFDFEKELLHMDREQLREVIYKEIMEFHQPRTPTLSFLACLRPAPKAGESCEGSGEGEPATVASFKDHLQAMMSSLSAAADKTGEDGGDQQAGSAIPGARETSVSPPRDSVLTQPLTQAFASQQGEEVFKKPVDKPTTKKSPVSVDTANLQLPCLRDVEMLSAQSTDGSKAMDTQTPRTPMAEKQKEADKESKTGEKKPTENKTISEDTKARVKQALLSHRQRTESCGEDDKPRPVTAAQRQREREEKRKKKRDSRMKKQEKKNTPQVTELSEADRELLARWSSMQKKPDPQPSQPTTAAAAAATVAQSTPAAAVIYLQHGNPTTPSPPQGNPGLSPPHPGPTSTPPMILPAGLIPQGQVTLVAGQLAMSQGPMAAAPQGQIIIPQRQMANLAQSQVGLSGLQGQVALQQGPVNVSHQQQQPPQQAGSGSSFHEGSMISLAELHRHSGGQLHITETQAEALREALKVSQSSSDVGGRRESGGGEAAGTRQAHTPPHATAASNDASDFARGQDASRSPHHDTASSSLAPQNAHTGQSFSPSPDPSKPADNVFSQTPAAGQNRSHQQNLARSPVKHEGNSPHHPQDLAEFLERHCQSPEKTDTLNGAGAEVFAGLSFGKSKVTPSPFESGSASSHKAFSQGAVKEEENVFGSCRYFSGSHSQAKPEATFSDCKAAQSQAAPQFSSVGGPNHSAAAPSFHSTMFQAHSGGTSDLCFLPQAQQASIHTPPAAQSFFLPSSAGASFVAAGQQAQNSAAVGLPFSGQPAVDGSNRATLPFSQYAEPTPEMVGAKDGAMVGSFGMGSHPSLAPGPMGSHPNLSRGSVGSHPGLAQASMGSHPNVAQASLGPGPPHQSAAQQAPHQAPSSTGSFGPQQMLFQTPLPLQASTSSHHHHHHPQQQQPHHHQHHPLPHNAHQDPPPPQFHAHPHLMEGQKEGPNLRVSAPKQGEGVDLVAMLSNKLSSIFPPSLSLTPRGTGAGYGVGMDLDVLMADAADSTGRLAELSPLSSSLLADWLDVSGNISQADLDALDQDFGMNSPMAMSYNEFNSSNSNNSSNAHWG